MAKKSLKIKQARPQKYATREYNRCKICGRPHAYIRKSKLVIYNLNNKKEEI